MFLISSPNEIKEYVVPKGTKYIAYNAFMNCRELCSISLPDSLEVIGNIAFLFCVKLLSVTIPQSVKEIGLGAFEGCFSLTTIVVDKDNLFYDSRNNCNAIIETFSNTLIAGCKTTIIPDSITKIGDSAFNHCDGLITITIPDSVVEIGKGIFSDCRKLETVIIPYGKRSKFENLLPDYKDKIIEQDEDENLSTEVTEEDLANAWIDEYGVKYSADRKRLLKAPKDLRSYSVINGTIIICDKAFFNCDHYGDSTSDLQSIVIANSVKAIGDYCFCESRKLTSIKIYNGIETIGTCAFENCTSIKEILLPKSLRKLGTFVFRDCINLYDVRFDCLLTSVSCGLFSGCHNLRNIDIPVSIEVIDNYAFYDCEELGSISIPPKTKEIRDFAFKGCESLTSIIIPEGVSYIGRSAFSGCTSLIQVSLPNSINEFGGMYEHGIRIEDSLSVTSFDNCELLESIYVPKDDDFIKEALWRYKDELIEKKADWMSVFRDTNILKMKLIEKKVQLMSKSLGSLISPHVVEDLKSELVNWELQKLVHFYVEIKIKFLFVGIKAVEVVDSDYGNSVSFFTKDGGRFDFPLSERSALCPGDILDINTAKILISFHKNKDNICKIIE